MGRFSILLTEPFSSAGGVGWCRYFQVPAVALVVMTMTLTMTPLVSGQNDDYQFRFQSSSILTPSSPATVIAIIDNPGGSLGGWSITVCHSSNIDILSGEPGLVTLTGNGGEPADFSAMTIFPQEGVRQGVVMSFTGINPLPPATGHEVAILQYELVGNPLEDPEVFYCSRVFQGDFSLSETLAVTPLGVGIEPVTIPLILGSTLPFTRGDANQDGRVDLADGVKLLQIFFQGDPVGCHDACDHNDDGAFNFADAVASLHSAFGNAPAPPPPGLGSCDMDPTDDNLICSDYLSCP